MKDFRLEIESGSVMGLNYSSSHDSSLAIVSREGSTVFASSLERLTRRKQDGRFPEQLLDLIDLDKFEVCAFPFYSPDDIPMGPTGSKFHTLLHNKRDYPLHQFDRSFYEQLDVIKIPKVYVGHHLAHAASAYYPSGFQDAMVLTYDGGMYNEPWFGGVFTASGNNISPVEYFPSKTNAKIASLYAIVTGLLGFSPLKHEGKITGLAAFGKPSQNCVHILMELLTTRYEDLESAGRWINAFQSGKQPHFIMNTHRQRELAKLFGSAPREEISASLQYVTEEHVLEIVQKIKDNHPSPRLCLSGGLFANVKLNQRIHELWGGEVFISPPMADDGTALGAALYYAFHKGKVALTQCTDHMYLGMTYEQEEVLKILETEEIVYEKLDDPAERLASLLASGKIVAVFTGAMEFGPRALGHRSILAAASDPNINDWLNKKLHRTEFMPFAPITRIEDADLEYQNIKGAEHTAEYMTITFDVTDHMRSSCPAVVHVDGTARPQLVKREKNGFLHNILTAYYELTGITSLVNTSFNIHEEPIICTPADALKGFFEAQLDYLYIEGYLIELAPNTSVALKFLIKKANAASQKEELYREIIDHLWSEINMLQNEADNRLEVIQSLEKKNLKIPPDVYDYIANNGILQELETRNKIILEKDAMVQKLTKELELAAREKILMQKEAEIQNLIREMEATRRGFLWPLSVLRIRLRPKLGVLYQYSPRPMTTPRLVRENYRSKEYKRPVISIVTPSFNQAAFLGRTIDSVLSQEYSGLEYIVQDGNSSDGSKEIIERYETLLAHAESVSDSGQADAINRGFQHATGGIMAYLNSDDMLLPGTLHYVADYFDRHPDVDIVYGHRVIVNESDEEVGIWILPPHDRDILNWADYIPQETLFWRRRVWDKIGGCMDENFRFALDWDLLVRFQEAGAKMVRLPRFLGCFRVHNSQKSTANIDDVGVKEMASIRRRIHGRDVEMSEVAKKTKPYLMKSLIFHYLFRLKIFSY